jgi:hypothetical protein
MLTTEQIKNITYVYNKLMETEDKGWDTVDDLLEIMEWLSDDQLYRECEVLYSYHKSKNMGCPHMHKPSTACFVENILEAVESILELYEETNNLHTKNRYILDYYVVLCQNGYIVESLNP